MVQRSNNKDTTKGKHTETIPIADGLLPYREVAIKLSPSELIFPRPEKRHDVDLAAKW